MRPAFDFKLVLVSWENVNIYRNSHRTELQATEKKCDLNMNTEHPEHFRYPMAKKITETRSNLRSNASRYIQFHPFFQKVLSIWIWAKFYLSPVARLTTNSNWFIPLYSCTFYMLELDTSNLWWDEFSFHQKPTVVFNLPLQHLHPLKSWSLLNSNFKSNVTANWFFLLFCFFFLITWQGVL